MSIESQHGFILFLPFLACEKDGVRKGFSKSLKKGLAFADFIFANFELQIFSWFLFSRKYSKIAKSRKSLHAKVSTFKVSEDPFMTFCCPCRYKNQRMCDEAADDCLVALKFTAALLQVK